MAMFDTQGLQAVGWSGFLDLPYMLESLAALALATALGALIAFHPMTRRTVDTLEEAELPKVYIMYALVGAMVGVIVLEYGIVVGFIVFGLGGLMRFRTDTGSTRDTGRLILVTLLGLICGLNLPHFAVLSALFAWILIYLFDRHPVCSLKVRAQRGRVSEAADAYSAGLKALGCKIISESTSVSKERLEYVFRMPDQSTPASLYAALCERIPADIRGELEWSVA